MGGRGSWADMVYCFQQLMRERVQYDTCGGNQYGKNNQENNKLFFGRLEGSRITKRGFWVWISDKSKKVKKTSGCKGWPKGRFR